MLRPAYMRLEPTLCIHCELCYQIAPEIARDPEHIPVGAATLEAMASCPTGAIVWLEEDEAPWDAVDEASWESFPASDPPSWWDQSEDSGPTRPPERKKL